MKNTTIYQSSIIEIKWLIDFRKDPFQGRKTAISSHMLSESFQFLYQVKVSANVLLIAHYNES